jgi:hypothetical protein
MKNTKNEEIIYAPIMRLLEPPHIVAKEFIRLRFPETWLWDEYHVG